MAHDHQLKFNTLGVVLGVVVGGLVGIVLQLAFDPASGVGRTVSGALAYGSYIYVSLLTILVAPLVFLSMAYVISNLGRGSGVSRIAGKTVGLYIVTTLTAVLLAFALSLGLGLGKGMDLSSATFSAKEVPSVLALLMGMIPTGASDLLDGNLYQIGILAILAGMALLIIKQTSPESSELWSSLQRIASGAFTVVSYLTPFGVAVLLANAMLSQDLRNFGNALSYFAVVVFCLAVQLFFVHGGIVKFIGGLSPLPLFRKLPQILGVAFATASSKQTLPYTLTVGEKRFGIHPKVGSVTLPFGATMNMDGTSISQVVAVITIAHATGVSLGGMDYFMILFLGTVSALGTAAIPGAGLITLAAILNYLGIPEAGIGLIIVVDRLLDMLRTSVNVSGDIAVACAVGATEDGLDRQVYNEV